MKRIFNFLRENKLIALVLLLWIAVQLYFLFTYPQSERPMLVISWDTFGYYLYLPATFIYHDLFDLKFVEAAMSKYPLSGYFYAARVGPTGDYVMNYSLGTAILYFPFFCLGHLVALLSQFEKDGFSAPYQYSIFVGGIFYSLIGLLITARNLRFFFSEKITGLLLLILLFGTNYLYYALIENAMTHNYLFTVGAIIIYYTIKWHDNQRMWYAIMLGLFIGLAIIIRPTEIFWCLIPLLWGLTNQNSVKAKIVTIWKNLQQLLALIMVVTTVGSLQIIYWKLASGKFIYYSYDGTFDFLAPHIYDGLFSIRKGWLTYTPVMALSLLGIPLLWLKCRSAVAAISVYILLVIYITFSWHAWSYGGSFGQRPMVQSYAVLVFPMGAFFSEIFRYRYLRYLMLMFITFCMLLNCFQTWQYEKGFISHDGLDRYHYDILFFKKHVNREMIREYYKLEQPAKPITDSAEICTKWFNANDTILADSNGWLINDSTGIMLFDSIIKVDGYSYLKLDARAMFDRVVNLADEYSFIQLELTQPGSIAKAKTYKLPLQPLIGNGELNMKYDIAGKANVWDDVFMYVPIVGNGPIHIRIISKNSAGNSVYLNNLRVSAVR